MRTHFVIISLLFFCGFSVTASAEETLTWQDCVREAQKNHPDLISAQEGINEARSNKGIAASDFLPQITSNASASRAKTTTLSSDNDKTSRIGNSYSYGVSGRQLLFDGFKTYHNFRSASENMKAAQFTYRFTSSEVRLRLRAAFINLLKAQELLRITEDIRNIRKNNLDLITLRYQSGLEHKGAMLTAQANLAEAEFEITQARRALEVVQRELTKEMGRREFSPMRAEGAFEVIDTASEKPDFEALARNNPSLEKLAAQKNAASYGLKATYANFLPEVSAEAGASRTGAHWLPKNDQWNAGLTASFPIFEGGLRLAQVSQARALLNQAEADEHSAKDGIILTLQQTWAALQDAAETVMVQKKFLEAAEERSKIAGEQYALGLVQFDNWTIIEDGLVTTKKTFLNAQANALIAEANWVQAKGETLEYAK